MRRKGIAVLVLLLAPALLFFSFLFEDGSKPVSEADVLKMIRASGGDMIEMLGDACGQCHGGETEYPVAGAVLSTRATISVSKSMDRIHGMQMVMAASSAIRVRASSNTSILAQ